MIIEQWKCILWTELIGEECPCRGLNTINNTNTEGPVCMIAISFDDSCDSGQAHELFA